MNPKQYGYSNILYDYLFNIKYLLIVLSSLLLNFNRTQDLQKYNRNSISD